MPNSSDNSQAQQRELTNSILDQIDQYGDQNSVNLFASLSDEAQRELTRGSSEQKYWRKVFVKHVMERLHNGDIPSYQTKGLDTRSTDPESATITTLDLLGEDGKKLLELAFAEEANSRNFLTAVCNKASIHRPGKKWIGRPVVFVSGPSGSGKSYAAEAAIEKISEFLPTDPTNNSGNFLIVADGGVAREVSQMLRFVKDLAFNHGYTGVSDIYDRSSAFKEIKGKLRKTAYLSDFGVVIPETFSKFRLPMIRKAQKLKNTSVMFCRVDGKSFSSLRKIVAFMGSRRAWKTSGFHQKTNYNLNQSPHKGESKAYQGSGFRAGYNGSKLAESFYRKFDRNKHSMIVVNDLMLIHDPKNDGNWVAAQPNDRGARLISARVFQAWKTADSNMSLKDFEQTPEGKPKPLIHTSIEIKQAILIKRAKHITNNVQPIHQKRFKNLLAELENVNWYDEQSVNGLEQYVQAHDMALKQSHSRAKGEKSLIREVKSLVKQAKKQYHITANDKNVKNQSQRTSFTKHKLAHANAKLKLQELRQTSGFTPMKRK